MRRLLLLTLLFACSKTAPVDLLLDGGTGLPRRSCETVLTFKPDKPIIQAYAAGEWNQFSTTEDKLRQDDTGAYVLKLKLPPGEHAYKLVVDGVWQLDPANPWTKYEGGELNSSLRVDDCATPLVTVSKWNAPVDAELQLTDSADAHGVDAAGLHVTVDGVPLVPASFSPDGRVGLKFAPLPAGKHVAKVAFSDRAGVLARELYLPFWVEDTPFEWRDALLYFAMVDRFSNGSTANDAPVAGVDPRANFEGGDFIGLRQKIEAGYFDALGVRAIWVSNPMKQPAGGWPGDFGPVTGYHGYWPTSDTDVEPRWGTAEELRSAVDAAHAHGIRVLLDFVANHVHSEHPWATQHPEWFNPLHISGGDCTCSNPPLCSFDATPLVCWFTSYLPDFDYTQFAAMQATEETAVRWMKETGADGLRVDAVKHFPHIVGTRLRARLHEELEQSGVPVYMVGETFTGADDAGKEQIRSYVSPARELSGQFDFPLYWQLQGAFAGSGSVADLDNTLQQEEAGYYGAGAVMSPFIDNHDQPRFVSVAAGQDLSDVWNRPPAQPTDSVPYDRMKLALTVLLTIPGMPLLWQGDEIAMAGGNDPDNRRMMQFSGFSTLQGTVLDHVRKLGVARKGDVQLRRGAYRSLKAEGDWLIYARGAPARIVAVNRSASAASATVSLSADLGLPAGTVLDDVLGGPSVTVAAGSVSLSLPARTSAVYLPH